MAESRGLWLGHVSLPTVSRHRRLTEELRLDPEDLLTHAFVCGATGSGKTVVGKAIVEECALAGIPSLIVDVKGDLTSLALSGQQTIDPRRSPALRGVLGDELETQQSGFTDSCADPLFKERARLFSERTVVRVLTPRSEAVRPVALASFPRFTVRPDQCDALERQDYQELMQSFVGSFLGRLYGSAKKVETAKSEASLLQALLEHAWTTDASLEGLEGLERLVHWLISPPIQRLGALPVDLHIDERARVKLARAINTQLVGLERIWHAGSPFDLETLITPVAGKTPIVILNISHLHNFFDQSFVIAQVCSAIYQWMRRKGGSSRPRLLFFLDEIGGAGGRESFFPSYPYQPPCKGPINLVLRQGRAFGVSCLFATQNVIGVDHRGLANCGTWIMGNLTSEGERRRIDQSIGQIGSFESAGIAGRLSALRASEFLLRRRDGQIEQFRERWLYTVHHTFAAHQLPALLAALEDKTVAGQPESGGPNGGSSDARQESSPRGDPDPGSLLPKAVRDDAVRPEAAHSAGSPTSLEPAAHPSDSRPRERSASPQPEPPPSSVQTGGDQTETSFPETVVLDPRAGASTGAWSLSETGGSGKWTLSPGQVYTIGRHKACDIVLKDPTVSRRHVVLNVTATLVHVTADTSAKNAPSLDDQPLKSGTGVAVDGKGAGLRVGDTRLVLRRT